MPGLKPGTHLVDPRVDRRGRGGNHRRVFRRAPHEVGDAPKAGGHDIGIPVADKPRYSRLEVSWNVWNMTSLDSILFGTARAAIVDRFILKRIPPLDPVSFTAQCQRPALVAGGRSLLRAAFSLLTTYGAADPRRSKMQTLVELPPTASSASGDAGAGKEDRLNPVRHGTCLAVANLPISPLPLGEAGHRPGEGAPESLEDAGAPSPGPLPEGEGEGGSNCRSEQE